MKRRTTLECISSIADGVLADVERAHAVKTAEVSAVREATPKSPMGTLMYKLAEELRSTSVDVTYDDIADAVRSRA